MRLFFKFFAHYQPRIVVIRRSATPGVGVDGSMNVAYSYSGAKVPRVLLIY